MSSGLKKVAGKGLKKLFNKIKDSKLANLGIGAGVTALIQSSGATSVMTIGFINAGIITIFQGIIIILGAYIGTTVTGVLVSLSSFNFAKYLVLTILIGVILSFFKKEKAKNIGEIFTGFGVLFFGLETMKESIVNGPLKDAFSQMFGAISFPLLLLLVGALFTLLTQSSSATSGIVIVMVAGGALSLTSGLYLVLGATIGTVVVTIVASIGGVQDAKRTAIICLVLRTITALIGTAIVWCIEGLGNNALSNWMIQVFGEGNVGLALALFLVVYNLIFVPALLPFINGSIKIANKVIKDKESESHKRAIKYIDKNMVLYPSVALSQAKREIVHMLNLSKDNLKRGFKMIITKNFDSEELLKDTEEDIDTLNVELTNFLITVSHDATILQEKKVGSYYHTINDIERIGDHAYNFYETAKTMVSEDLDFSEFAKKELKGMFDVVIEMFDVAEDVFTSHRLKELDKLHALEDETDKLKSKLNDAHFYRVAKNKCTNELSPYFSGVIGELERVADHLVNVGYSCINPIGDDEDVSNKLQRKNG